MKQIQKKIKKEDVERCPLLEYDGDIALVKTLDSAEKIIDMLMDEAIVGFDIESQPSFKKGENYPAALIQLAGSKGAYVFQLKPLGGIASLKRLLEAPKPIKVGVAIQDDIKKLKETELFDDQGFVDISGITARMGIENKGLRNLVAMFMGKRVSKAMRTSNWGNARLSAKQLTYAATDAWVSRELYLKVKEYERR